MNPAKVRRLGATHRGKSYKVSWFIAGRLSHNVLLRLTYLNNPVPERMHHIPRERAGVDAAVLQINEGESGMNSYRVLVIRFWQQTKIPVKQINKTSRHDKGRDDAHLVFVLPSAALTLPMPHYQHEQLLKKICRVKKITTRGQWTCWKRKCYQNGFSPFQPGKVNAGHWKTCLNWGALLVMSYLERGVGISSSDDGINVHCTLTHTSTTSAPTSDNNSQSHNWVT